MLAALILALLSQSDPLQPQGPIFSSPARMKHGPKAKDITNAVAGGDKSGSWWALKSNGTMLSGSSLTMTAHGSPGVSPLTFDGSTQWFESSTTVAFPVGNFSVVYVFDPTINTTQYFVSKWDPVTTFICGLETKAILYMATPSFSEVDSVATVPAGSFVGVGCTYTVSSGVGTVRVSGVTASATLGAVQTGMQSHAVGGTSGGANLAKGSSRGVFFTEKVLSDADIDRIIAGAM